MYNIVLVDDERLELETLQNYVPWSDMGFRIIGTAKNGKEGLSKLGELLPDILITDVKMPIMDGVEFAGIARSLLPHLKIIFLSGYDDFAYVKSALQVEASGYLLKPLDMDELYRLMEKVKQKCIEEQRGKQSARALAIQLVHALLREMRPHARKLQADEILSLRLEPLNSVTGMYSFSLITIDEFPSLMKYIDNGAAIITEIKQEIERLALAHEALVISISEYQHLVISVRDTLQDMLQWSQELGAFTQWVTFCSYSRQAELEQLTEIYPRLLQQRNRHLFLYGAGHFIVAEESAAGLDPTAIGIEADAVSVQVNKPVPEIDHLHAHIQQGRRQEINDWVADFISAQMEAVNGSMAQLQSIVFELLDQLYVRHVISHSAIKEKMEDKTALFNKLTVIESIPYLEQMIRSTVLQMMSAVAEQELDRHTVIVRQLKKLIKEQYDKHLTIEFLAGQVYMSPNYLRTIFKEHTDTTVLEYVTQVRMEHAVELLQEGSLKIHEISARVGYENPSHFCAIFLKKRGLTPNQYRNQMLRL